MQNWVLTNWKNFQGSDNAPIYGWIDGEQVCVIPNCLRAALEEAGFSVRKSLRAFVESGALITDSQGRSSDNRRHPKTKVQGRVNVFRKSSLFGPGENSYSLLETDEPLPF